MQPRRSRTVSAILALSLVVSLFGGGMVWASTSKTANTFSGYVSTSGVSWVTHDFEMPSPSIIGVTLGWSNQAADLNLFLKYPDGVIVASDLSKANPATVSYTTAETGTWRIGVKAKSGGSSYTATVVLTPTGPPPTNNPPVAGDDSASTSQGAVVDISVLSNDLDPDGGALSVSGLSDPPHGSVVLKTGGVVAYTPDAGYSGSDSFTYQACDNGQPVACDGANVSITIIPPPPPPPPGGGSVEMSAWAAEFMVGAHVVTEATAVAQAKAFGIISPTGSTYKNWMDEMRAANPDVLVLGYLNGAFAQSDQGNAYPESWYARDASGNKVKSMGFGNYLMKIADSGWISDVIARCQATINNNGYDGCFIDMLGPAPLFPGYLTSMPINPATGQIWTRPDWLAATTNIGKQVTTAVSPKLVYGNGLTNGKGYFSPLGETSQILEGLSGAMAETFVRAPNEKIDFYRSETEWKQNVDMLVDAGARGEHVLAMTKVWCTGTQAQKDAWHRYALATFLLGDDGNGLFSFRYDHEVTNPHPYWDPQIGAPVGPYAKINGVYQRSFVSGKALVNPTTSTYTINLGGTYRTLQGNLVTTLTMGPHTGEVLELVG